jgi:hypothetical protein
MYKSSISLLEYVEVFYKSSESLLYVFWKSSGVKTSGVSARKLCNGPKGKPADFFETPI